MKRTGVSFFKRMSGRTAFIAGFIFVALALVPLVAFGQLNINTIPGGTFNLGTADLLSTVIRIVQWALGFLALIAVIFIIYGGYVWLTAAGNADKVKKAKRIITQAVIGLVIVMLAFAIVSFIFRVLGDATSGTGFSCTPNQPAGIDCQRCNATGNGTYYDAGLCGGSSDPTYFVRWTIPQDVPKQTDVALCSIVGAGFDGVNPPWLNKSSITDSNIYLAKRSDPTNHIAGAFTWPQADPQPDSNSFEFKPTADLEANTDYVATVTNGVTSKLGSYPSVSKSWEFTTGTTSDTNAPRVPAGQFAPTGNNVCLQPTIVVQFSEPMAPSSFTAANVTVTPDTGARVTSVRQMGSNGNTLVAEFDRPLNANTTYQIHLNADQTTGFRDTCYNALDCGNTNNVCTSNGTSNGTPQDDFIWSFTTKDTQDVSCNPEIASISNSGPYSNNGTDAITITGQNFVSGVVGAVLFPNKFVGNQIYATDAQGTGSFCFNTTSGGVTGFKPNWAAPPSNSVACVQSWTDSQIRVIVPSGQIGSLSGGATGGNIQVLTAGGKTSQPNGGFSSVTSPHASMIWPPSGGTDQYVTISGENFTNTPGRVFFRKADGTDVPGVFPTACGTIPTWRDNSIIVKVPAGFAPGDRLLVQVDTSSVQPPPPNGTTRSNLLTFNYNGNPPGPGICGANKSCDNTAGQSITLQGEFFGTTQGASTGYYVGNNTGVQTPQSYGAWSDTSVQMTSRTTLPNDQYSLYLKVNNVESNPFQYYSVPCGGVPQVVSDATCSVANAKTPSPNPVPDSQDICTNVNFLNVRFTEDINSGDLNTTNFQMLRCAGDKTGCAGSNLVSGVSTSPLNDIRLNVSGAGFVPNTWYQVRVSGNIRSNSTNSRMGNDFMWYFKTRTDPTACRADAITLAVTGFTGVYNEPYSNHPNTLTYQATPASNTCQFLSIPGAQYNWSSSAAAIANCIGGNCAINHTDTQAIVTQGIEGQANIGAQLDSLSAQKQLNVVLNYCQRSSQCNQTIIEGGNPVTCSSTCNVIAQRCDPHIYSLNPSTGPITSLTTIRGCFFGSEQGSVKFAAKEAVYACAAATWAADGTTITVEVPKDPAPPFNAGDTPQVSVTTGPSYGSLLSNNTLPFTISGQCSNGQNVPASGVPKLCGITPSSAGENRDVNLSGSNFSATRNGSDNVLFNPNLTSTIAGWNDTLINGKVPVGATSGNVTVQVDNGSSGVCPSNPLPFTVSCSTGGDCNSGCCVSGACVNSANCLAGNAGDQCHIVDNAYNADPSCNAGVVLSTDPSHYKCISNTGYANAPAPAKPLPANGTACTICCDPDPNRDGNYSDAQTFNGLSCTPIPVGGGTCASATTQAAAPQNMRGLYCGCSSDNQCGGGTACATQNDSLSCCRARPAVTTVASNLACLNSAISYTFNQQMDQSTLNLSNIHVTNATTGVTINGRIVPSPSGFTFLPQTSLTSGQGVRVVIGLGVKNFYGISLSVVNDQVWNVTGTNLCRVDHVNFRWWHNSQPTNFPLLYTCNTDGCTDDLTHAPAYPAHPGNQIFVSATGVDADNHPLSGITYHWDDVASNGIYKSEYDGGPPYATPCPQDDLAFSCLLSSLGKNGTGNLTITANAGAAGQVTNLGRINSFMCEKPWPDGNTNAFPFEDTTYNFSMAYCRTTGNLPALLQGQITENAVTYTSPLIKNNVPSIAAVDELLREYFFITVDDSSGTPKRIGSDAIGVRIMENEMHLPPDLWFKRLFSKDPGGTITKVDGYEALQVGNTIYIAATNRVTTGPGANEATCAGPVAFNTVDHKWYTPSCNGAKLYDNVYVIAYSQGASAGTVGIYNQLISNILFNTNVAEPSLRVDEIRFHNLVRTALSLVDRKLLTGAYPKLEAGSYLKHISLSAWPSWNGTLGKELNTTLAVDPVNTFSATSCALAGYDSNTCWNEQNKKLIAKDASQVLQYNYNADGTSTLYGHFGYYNPGTWRNTTPVTGGDACSTARGNAFPSGNPWRATDGSYSNCQNYTFVWNSIDFENWSNSYRTTGAMDSTAPTVVIEQPANNATIAATTTVRVKVTDVGGSGTDRVEFYVDNVLKSTDASGTNGGNDWTWDINPLAYLNGSHTIRVTAYDRASNATNVSITITVQNSANDTTPPVISGYTVPQGVIESPTDIRSIAVSGLQSIQRGSIWVATYWSNPVTLQRCTDDLSSCTVVVPNMGPLHAAGWKIGKDPVRNELLVHASNQTVYRYNATTGVRVSPDYNFTQVTGSTGDSAIVEGMANGNLIVWDEFKDGELWIVNPADMTKSVFHTDIPNGLVSDVSTDRFGNFYVTDGTHHKIYKLNSDLSMAKTFGDGQVEDDSDSISSPNGIFVDGDSVYVTEDSRHDLVKFDLGLSSKEHIFGVYGVAGNDNSHLSNPQEVIVHNGYLYVANSTGTQRVVRIPPQNGPTVRGSVTLRANATDNVSVTSMKFYVGTNLVGECVTGTPCNSGSSYSVTFDSSRFSDDSYTVYVAAFDVAGNSTTIRNGLVIFNNIDTEPPIVVLTNPTNGSTVGGNLEIQATAFDNKGIASLKVRYNGTDLPTSSSYPNPDSSYPYHWMWNTHFDPISGNPIPNGTTASISVIATDVTGLTQTVTSGVTIQNGGSNTFDIQFTRPSADNVPLGTGGITLFDFSGNVSHVVLRASNATNSATLGDLSNGPTYNFAWRTTLPDGTYDLTATAYDARNNSVIITRTGISIDNNPPSITTFNPAAGATYSGNIPLTVTANDGSGLASVSVTLNPGNQTILSCSPGTNNVPCTTSWNTASQPDGTYSITATVIDTAGNSTTQTHDNINLANGTGPDTTPPNASIAMIPPHSAGGINYNRGTPTIEVTATDDIFVTAIDVFISNQLVDRTGAPTTGHTCTTSPCNVSWATASIPDGTAVALKGNAYDSHNNRSADANLTVIVDNSGPSMIGVTDDGVSTNNATQLHATWTGADPQSTISGYEYSIGTTAGSTDTRNWTSAGSNTFVNATGLTLVNNSTYFFNVRAINGSGMTSSAISSDGILYCSSCSDVTPPTDPVLTFNPPISNGWVRGSVTITATSSDSGTGLGEIDINITGGTTQSCTTGAVSPCVLTLDTTTLSNGAHTVSATAWDKSVPRNFSTTVSVPMGVDNARPTFTSITPVNNTYVSNTVNLAAIVSDPESGPASVSVHLNDVTGPLIGTDSTPGDGFSISWNTRSGSYPDASYALVFVALDNLGNASNATTNTYRVDNSGNILCGTSMCTPNVQLCCNAGSNSCYTPGSNYCCSGVVSATPCSGGGGGCYGCTGGPKDPLCCLGQTNSTSGSSAN